MRTSRRHILLGLCGLWSIAAFIIPAAGLGMLTISSTDLWLMAMLALVTAVTSNIEFQLTGGEVPVRYTPDGQPLVMAAVFLHPALAMVVALAEVIDYVGWQERVALWKSLAGSSMMILATGLAAVASHLLFGSRPHGMWVLPAACLAALVFDVAQAGMWALLREAMVPGNGMRFLIGCFKLLPVNVGINALAVALISPFVGVPLLALLLFTVLQTLNFLLSKLSTSENMHREQSLHLRDVFSRYVPTHVADRLADSGTQIELGGEEREITVLFADIRGFTTWSENETPETIITELNALLRGLSGAVMEADGTLDKFTGDGLMAFWGAPLDQPDHAERAWSASIDMLMRLKEVNRERASSGQPPFNIGIGINSGNAVVGNIGHEDRLDYTAIGDTVNTSARLEAATKDVGSPVVISRATWERLPLDKRRICDRAGDITVKGKRQPVEVYALPSTLHNPLEFGSVDAPAPLVDVDLDDYFGDSAA